MMLGAEEDRKARRDDNKIRTVHQYILIFRVHRVSLTSAEKYNVTMI